MNQAPTVLRRYRVHLAVIVANAVFAAVFVSVALSWFHQPTPQGIRVGLVAPARLAQAIRANLGEHVQGGFDVQSLATEERARFAISHRGLDGALVVSPRATTLLTAGAGGTAPKQAITVAFTPLAAKTGRPLTTMDVVPPASSDSQGLSAYFLILCVLFPSLGTGIAAGHLLGRASPASRVAVLVGLGVVSGLVGAGNADGISGLGHYWAIAGIVGVFSLAISAPTAALAQIRLPLAALSVLVFVIFGIPVSGGPANFAAFGPGSLRWLSEVLPLGVAASTVRNTVYFHASDTTAHLWVLSAFAAAGLAALWALTAAARRRNRGAPVVATLSVADRPATPTMPLSEHVVAAVLGAPHTLDPRA